MIVCWLQIRNIFNFRTMDLIWFLCIRYSDALSLPLKISRSKLIWFTHVFNAICTLQTKLVGFLYYRVHLIRFARGWHNFSYHPTNFISPSFSFSSICFLLNSLYIFQHAICTFLSTMPFALKFQFVYWAA